MKRTRLYNTATGKWEYWTIMPAKTPWRVAWIRLRDFLRYARRHSFLFPSYPTEYDFDPVTLDIRDPKRERRQRRRDRRDGLFRKVADALNSMIQMQKFIN